MQIVSTYDAPMDIFHPGMPERAPGLHLSTIIKACAEDLYPKWFGKYPEDEKRRHVGHFEKGLVLEQVWGDSLEVMIGPSFTRPLPTQTDEVWCSPDGYVYDGQLIPDLVWPAEYPKFQSPAIHECKVTLKSCNEDTSPIEHEKFITWKWQVMGYCYAWKCFTAYIHVLHICGDYKQRPWSPKAAVHRFDFTSEELAKHWAWLLQEAKERGLTTD